MPSGKRASGPPAASPPHGRATDPPVPPATAGVPAADAPQPVRNVAPGTPAEADAAAPATGASGSGKKRRVLSACVRCATKKVKCDGNKPCSVCSSLGLGAECHFNPNPKKRGPPKGYWDAQRKMREEAEALSVAQRSISALSSKLRKRRRAGAQSSDPASTSAPPPPEPAPWQRYTEPAGPEFPSSMHRFRSQAPSEASTAPEARPPARPRLPPLSEMHATAPPPLSTEVLRAPDPPRVPPNMFRLNPPPPPVPMGPAHDPTALTPYESRLIEIYIAFVHDHWPLLAPNVLFAPGLGASEPDPVPVVNDPKGATARPQTLSSYIASLKGKIPLLFQLICCTAANTLLHNWSGKGANIVAGIPVQPGEPVTGEELDELVEKCRLALMPFAHIRAIWVVQALFLLALTDYSAGRMHEGWQSTGQVCRLVADMNLHRSHGETVLKRMMQLASEGAGTATSSSGATHRPVRFVHTMLADINLEERIIAQEERAMYVAAGAYTIEEIIQVRRRVFWSSFVLDKFVSVLTERPCMLRCAEVDVNFPNPSSLDDTQPWLTWSSVMFVQPNVIPELKGIPARMDTCFSVVSQLCVITEFILDVLYSPSRRTVPGVPALAHTKQTATSDSLSAASGMTGSGDEGGVMASRWLSETLALSGGLGDIAALSSEPEKGLPESYLRIMRMLTLWSEYMPAPMRARRMPLTYAQPLPPDANPLGPTDLFVMPPRHSGSPPSFLSMRAWTHLNILLLHRPFIIRPHLLSLSLPQLRKYGFAPTLPAERASQLEASASRPRHDLYNTQQQQTPPQPLHPDTTTIPTPSQKKPTMKVSITSLLVEQRRHRAKSTSLPVGGTVEGKHTVSTASEGPSALSTTSPGTAGKTFLLPLSHAAQVCIQAAAEIIDIADAYKGLYPPRKLPHIWVYMLFQAGTVMASFSINMSPVLSPSSSDGYPVQSVDPGWFKRSHDTSVRCRSLLSRCLSSLQAIEVSHPSARDLVRILNSLADVAAGVNAAAKARTPSSCPEIRGTETSIGAPTAPMPVPLASQTNPLMLLARQAETERSSARRERVEEPRPSLVLDPPHPWAGSTSTSAQTQLTDFVELAAWEPFWEQMPFGANWDSWREFFVNMASNKSSGDQGAGSC